VSTRELLKAKRAEILEIASRHGASNVRIFGSVARGEADRHSSVDVVTAGGLRPGMRDRVLQEAVPL